MEGFNWSSEDTGGDALPPHDYHGPNNSSELSEPMSFDVVTAIVYSVVFFIGLVGNTLTIYVVLRYVKMKTVTNIYILNLALADELYILGIPFLGTNSVISYWPYGNFFCKVCITADAMSQFASTYCLTVMSIDRYLAVVHPVRSAKWRKPRVAKFFSALVWVVSFLIVLPVTIYSGVQEEINSCNITWPEPQELWALAFILYTAILSFFGPLVVICLCYLLILIRVRTLKSTASIWFGSFAVIVEYRLNVGGVVGAMQPEGLLRSWEIMGLGTVLTKVSPLAWCPLATVRPAILCWLFMNLFCDQQAQKPLDFIL